MGQTRRPPSMARKQHWPVTVVQKRGPTHIIMAAAPPAPSNISIKHAEIQCDIGNYNCLS